MALEKKKEDEGRKGEGIKLYGGERGKRGRKWVIR